MDEACPHRGASMMLACNEEGGLRCVYHGWKIAPSGAVVDAPTHPEDTPLSRLRSRARPVVEKFGIVWAWLGQGAPAEFPRLVISDLAEDQVLAACCVINCSWLHPLETLWDVFHAQILHNQTNRKSMRSQAYFGGQTTRQAGHIGFNYPEMEVRRTE
jgi:phenylpropionate dioxygenase-like ring-hydroxylating dioxygenase large terminal subunit